ncbi:1-hydroxycarotenoid 3,4-desaturase CrtD [Jannaschia pohangensis]|uniref:1-hydroxycarotenoid 3,4-desaturase n=1 Tax=Jannaschia pohangensis TaxID=390807 RepID=A0A1I3UN10_9RHOB|nr:1-hydroxycarotenoid 3,4-desaturase CrtD [Jannaschia pohangensis]SFJ84834.1 1-hydroxycarotenoid 3,4-desaturase [Jannaschia pohangensis]
MTDQSDPTVIIGAGIGGLAAALRLAHAGRPVTVLERAATPGGKMRALPTDAGPVDAGPTVLTLRHVFDELFADVGESLSNHVTLRANPVLARHFWSDGTTLDLMADEDESRANVAAAFGSRAADDFTRFSARTRRLFQAFDVPMMQAATPSQRDVTGRVLRQPRLIRDMAPLRSLSQMLRGAFAEPKLQQLFGRYATYVGGIPALSPAILSLIWHAESSGVWSVAGGMHSLARAIEGLARDRGVAFHYDTHVTGIEVRDGRATAVLTEAGRHPAEAVLFNGDPRALTLGYLGAEAAAAVPSGPVRTRSLSAHVHAFAATPSGPPLAAHNVFFADSEAAEFDPLARGEVPVDATLYICAQDRGADATPPPLERFEIIRNAPPAPSTQESPPCPTPVFQRLAQFGLTFSPEPGPATLTDPAAFDRLFPGSSGSLYGQSPHGMMAAFARPTARTRIKGLYLAGGGAHPGAGVPMATLSGRHAAAAILQDRTSTSASRRAAMPGGMSTGSAMTAPARSRS